MKERIDYESPDYYRRELKLSRARLRELEERGVEALSGYDITIAHGGNAAEALRVATWLVGNHVVYFARRLEELGPEPPKQATLFELPDG